MSRENMNFQGIVKPYNRNGTKFGFPTANIVIEDKSLDGLFIGYTKLLSTSDPAIKKAFAKQAWPSIIFIGSPETLNETDHRLESYILDFPTIDLYGAEIKVKIKEKLRDNQKFDSIDDLIAQMKKDKLKAQKWFRENSVQ